MQPKDILDALHWRAAVQSFDPTKKISPTDLETILESGRLAPSSFGLEAWKFIVVENQALRQAIQEASYGQPRVTEASHLIVIARRTDVRQSIAAERIDRTAKIQGQPVESLTGFRQMLDGVIASKDDASLDRWIACQTYIPLGIMMETASLLGIDNAAMEGFDPQAVDTILGLGDQHLTATTLLALGYRSPADEWTKRPKVRRSLEKVTLVMR